MIFQLPSRGLSGPAGSAVPATQTSNAMIPGIPNWLFWGALLTAGISLAFVLHAGYPKPRYTRIPRRRRRHA